MHIRFRWRTQNVCSRLCADAVYAMRAIRVFGKTGKSYPSRERFFRSQSLGNVDRVYPCAQTRTRCLFMRMNRAPLVSLGRVCVYSFSVSAECLRPFLWQCAIKFGVWAMKRTHTHADTYIDNDCESVSHRNPTIVYSTKGIFIHCVRFVSFSVRRPLLRWLHFWVNRKLRMEWNKACAPIQKTEIVSRLCVAVYCIRNVGNTVKPFEQCWWTVLRSRIIA